TLASGSDDATIRLWDVATGAARGTPLAGHKDGVTSVSFSPDGKTLASGSDDATIRLWDVATGAARGTPLAGHTDRVTSVSFSPDGKTLASGSFDATIRLWDVATGAEVRNIAMGQSIGDVAFTTAGGRAGASGRPRLATSAGNEIRIWDIEFDASDAERIREEWIARNFLGRHPQIGMAHAALLANGTLENEEKDRIAAMLHSLDEARIRDRIRTHWKKLLIETDVREAVRTDQEFTESVRPFALSQIAGTRPTDDESIRLALNAMSQSEPSGEKVRRVARFAADMSERQPDDRRFIGLAHAAEWLTGRSATSNDERQADPVEFYNGPAWSTVRVSGGSPSDYETAFTLAECATLLAPNIYGILNTLGVAQFRTGRYIAARETLTKTTRRDRPDLSDYIFLALTEKKLGNDAEAARIDQELRKRFGIDTDPDWCHKRYGEPSAQLEALNFMSELREAFEVPKGVPLPENVFQP
ncbi:hypothetical protein GC170_21420, partial [bacterium]|nr:hypothetical protein [bacterium]